MSIALSLGNNLTTGGVFKAAAVNNTSCNNVTDFASVPAAATMVLLSTQTASASSSISFTSSIDSTYDEYIFKFINIHPSGDGENFTFNGSTDGGSNYNVAKTTTSFRAVHDESDVTASLGYESSFDLANSTSYQDLNREIGADNDQCKSGFLHLFAPSSTTYIKHFLYNGSRIQQNDHNSNNFVAGFFNTTSAINAIDFKFSSGNIDAGVIKMYGVKKS